MGCKRWVVTDSLGYRLTPFVLIEAPASEAEDLPSPWSWLGFLGPLEMSGFQYPFIHIPLNSLVQRV